ncbi:DMT family transporter [Natrarchaeobius halalkaliphilus]|uniref:DMT family transporter n=1 Tax=Natrarchaeobius halalkaliphilus TaxID=1679091 RepID=A0A3N6LJG3_9EURY|nr:EamA family transporter [Natrarchaeobius halalkaliphilus]RQG88823.1 DMT family transporter [Natrarchaeobius halalkaliphilus]
MVLEISDALLGVLLAIAGAIAFSGQFLFVRLGTEDGGVDDAVLVVLLCNVAMVVPPVAFLYSPPYSSLFTPASFASFAGAGLAGMFVARLLMFKSIEEIGASLTSPVIASNVLFATVFAVFLLGERLTTVHFVGIVLIVVGLAVVSWETAATTNPDQSIRDTGATLVLPFAAAVCIGIEPIFVSTGLSGGTPILPGLAVMSVAGTVGFVSYLAMMGSLRPIEFRSTSTAWYVGAGVSTTVGFLAYFSALEIAPVVIVMPLLQLTPLIVALISMVFLPQRLERVTWPVVASALVVVVGAALVSLSG